MKTIHIPSQDELPQVAGAIIGSLGRRTVVAFRGEMGAGKTTLIREIAAELGAADTVTSPTFAIVNQYKGEGNRRIHHFDFYRINDLREAFDFGYEESGGVAREDRTAAARQHDDGAHHRRQRHGTHLRDRLTAGLKSRIQNRPDSKTANPGSRRRELSARSPHIAGPFFQGPAPVSARPLPLRNRIPGRTPQRFVPFVCRHRKNPYLCSGHNRRP